METQFFAGVVLLVLLALAMPSLILCQKSREAFGPFGSSITVRPPLIELDHRSPRSPLLHTNACLEKSLDPTEAPGESQPRIMHPDFECCAAHRVS